MPIPKGKKALTKNELFDELRHGKTFSRTAAKRGKKKAEKQMVAIALQHGRERGFKKPIAGEAKKLHAARRPKKGQK